MSNSGSLATDKQFILSGPSKSKDKRITPLRGDLADISLAGKHFAPHYAVPQEWHCAAPYTPVFAEPNDDTAHGELLAGEGFYLLDRVGDLGWGRCAVDSTVGFVRFTDLAEGAGQAISVRGGALTDFAEQALSAPYQAGGRGGAGYDAGGLVQQAAAGAGLSLPHFADLQAVSGALLAADDPARGALVFVKDMAAICISETEIIMACRSDQAVVTMPLARLAAAADDAHPLIFRKMPS